MNENETRFQLEKLQSCVQRLQLAVEKMERIVSQKDYDGIEGWISEEQVRELTGLSTSTLYELRKTKQVLSSFITPKTIVYNKKSLVKLIEKNARK